MHPSILAALVLVALPSTPVQGEELRGLWVIRTALASPADVDRVVDQAAEGGFNTLFVQVRGRGEAFYQSRLVARSEALRGQPADFDPLGRLLARARRSGLAVHAWLNTLLAAHLPLGLPEGHVLARHPEWAMVPRTVAREALLAEPGALLSLIRDESRRVGDIEGFYLSPAQEGVRLHLEEVVRELVASYPVDGVHLDFIRYPGPEFDYSRAALEAFRVGRGDRTGELLEGPTADPAGWAAFRRDTLTRLADRLCRAAREARPGICLSAAVAPDEAQALHHKFQDWPRWLLTGVLDAVCPMVYTEDTRLFRRQVERARGRVGPRVWIGVGSYQLPVETTIEQIRVAREAGAAGVVLFSHESFGPRELARLRREVFPQPGGAGAAAGSLKAPGQ